MRHVHRHDWIACIGVDVLWWWWGRRRWQGEVGQQELKNGSRCHRRVLAWCSGNPVEWESLSFGDLLPKAFTSSLHHHVVNAGTPNGVSDYAAGRYALLLYLA